MVQTCRHECFGLCAALDTAMKPCQATAASGLPWCSRHNEERMKLYLNYKTHHNSLRKIDQTTACTTAPRVRVCASLDRLRAWHGSLMCKYRLITRCIDAREYFTERFFGNDMDFGHQQFWRALVKQQTDTERLLSEVERRTYELILISQNALWVLKQSNDPSDSTLECSGYDDSSLSKSTSSDTDSDSNSSRSFERKLRQCQNAFADVEDPLEVALREKATALREKIYTRMARYCAPAESKLYKERLEVIYALVRRAVYTDASLMVQCQAYESVMEFLEDADLEVNTLEKFWTALKELYTNEARAAIDDVLRPKDDTSDAVDYVVLLGGRVYKTQSGMQWPFRAWAHFTSIVKCYTCLRNICVSVDEVAGLTRYVILTRTNVNQSYLKCWHPVERGSALMLCGSLVNSLEPTQYNPRYTISKCNSCLDRRPQWSETETNLVLCMGLSLTDPKTEQFVEACKKEPDFMILCRRGRDGDVVRSQERIWYKRIRRARTRGGLKKVSWESVGKDSILYLRDSVLQETFVQTTRTVKLQDCYQLAVVDTQAEDITAVVGKLAVIWMKVYGAECAHQLWDNVGKAYVESGDLEIQDEPSIDSAAGCCPCKSYVPGIEKDVLASYCRLWNRTPVGRVSDD